MNYKLGKFFVFVLTIFIAEIVSIWAKNYLNIHTGYKSPYILTAIQMAIMVAIYYPLFNFISGIAENVSKSFVKITKKTAGGGSMGLIIAFLIGLGIVYIIFLKLWYHLSIW